MEDYWQPRGALLTSLAKRATDRIASGHDDARARFLASLPVDSPLGRHGVRQFLHADNWEDAEGFVPDLYVSIPDDAFERWRAAIQNQAFARGETYGFRYIDYYTAMMSAKGCLAGTSRACGFVVGGSSKFQLAGP